MGIERKDAMEKAKRMLKLFFLCGLILQIKNLAGFVLFNRCVTVNKSLKQPWGPVYLFIER